MNARTISPFAAVASDAGGGSYAIVVAYADDEAQIKELWPSAEDIDAEERSEYVFTDRFPKPDWLA